MRTHHVSQTALLAHTFGQDAAKAGLGRDTLEVDREAIRAIRDAAYTAGHVDAYDVVDSYLIEAWRAGYDKMTATPTCPCGNPATEDGLCEWCTAVEGEPAHTGHYSQLGGAWWCDTCNSPMCALL
jgi:hypothetical protein